MNYGVRMTYPGVRSNKPVVTSRAICARDLQSAEKLIAETLLPAWSRLFHKDVTITDIVELG